jgi:hypothetical protein
MATSDLLIWVDCEMTGLDLINDELIEVAALVTGADLNVLGHGVDLVIKPSQKALEQMGDFVRGMHEASGLLSLLDSGCPWLRPSNASSTMSGPSSQNPAKLPRRQYDRHRSGVPGARHANVRTSRSLPQR